MIPKIIHYCWFGGKDKPVLAQKCIASWHKFCPDYKIIEWNESNFDVNLNPYTKMCYEEKKWAFLSDYVRLWVVYKYGGLYFDTDVELLKNPDFLLNQEAFFGWETDDVQGDKPDAQTKSSLNSGLGFASVASGLGFASVASGLGVEIMLKEYDTLLDGKHGVTGCPKLNTLALQKLGLKRDGSYQKFDWGTVYPKDYFNPLESTTGVLKKTKNTVSVHWYMGSCLSTSLRIRGMITRPFHRIFGVNCFAWLKR